MLQELLKVYKVEEFTPLYDYICQLDSADTVELCSDEIVGVGSREIQIKINDILFTVVILVDRDKRWISFYRYNSLMENIEMFDFVLYSHEYMKKQENEKNRIIQYSAIKYRDDQAQIINSAYVYKDNICVSGWKKNRTVSKENGHYYATHDNIANLSCHIDNNNMEIYDKTDNDKVKVIERFY